MSVFLHGFVCLVCIFGGYLQLFSDPEKVEDQVFIIVPENLDIPRTPNVEPTIAIAPPDLQPIRRMDDLPPLPPPPDPTPPKPVPTPLPSPRPKPSPAPAPPKTLTAEEFRKQNPNRRNTSVPRPPAPRIDPNAVLIDAPDFTNIREGATTRIPPAPTADETNRYKALVAAKAKSSWIAPVEFSGQILSASVRIEIAANGKVASFRFTKSSRQPVYDKAIEELLKMITFPLPPRGKPFVIHINFNSDNVR